MLVSDLQLRFSVTFSLAYTFCSLFHELHGLIYNMLINWFQLTTLVGLVVTASSEMDDIKVDVYLEKDYLYRTQSGAAKKTSPIENDEK